mmetsp:Transcript_126692/g.364409  ORF Transcript_126692/g.364409 Transcript_126692/m.364409 type:complete len:224 (+) Transcript_126692:274-945(+)
MDVVPDLHVPERLRHLDDPGILRNHLLLNGIANSLEGEVHMDVALVVADVDGDLRRGHHEADVLPRLLERLPGIVPELRALRGELLRLGLRRPLALEGLRAGRVLVPEQLQLLCGGFRLTPRLGEGEAHRRNFGRRRGARLRLAPRLVQGGAQCRGLVLQRGLLSCQALDLLGLRATLCLALLQALLQVRDLPHEPLHPLLRFLGAAGGLLCQPCGLRSVGPR